MKKLTIWRVAHLIYLGLLILFIIFYFTDYQPVKLHRICAESSANDTLVYAAQTDAFAYYQQTYNNCISQKSINLFAFLNPVQ